MTKTHLLMFCACVLTLAFQTQLHAQEKVAKTDLAVPADAVGKHCVIKMNNQPKKTSTQFTGKIKRVTGKQVVLTGAVQTVRTEQSAPLIGGIPYISRLFKNVGIAQQAIEGDQEVPRAKIASLKIINKPNKEIWVDTASAKAPLGSLRPRAPTKGANGSVSALFEQPCL